jgi:hypothetical protein
MSFFCLLWVPLFYLLWRAITGNASAGGIWALLAGCITALVRFFLGSLVDPGGFGVTRWLSGLIDIVALPVLAPMLVYLLLVFFKLISGSVDFANFVLLWLIPGAILHAVNRNSQGPIPLVLVPVLWTAIAVGIPFFISVIQKAKPIMIVLSSLGMLIVPFAAVCSYWAFFTQKNYWGFLFFLAAAAPMLVSVILTFMKAEE